MGKSDSFFSLSDDKVSSMQIEWPKSKWKDVSTMQFKYSGRNLYGIASAFNSLKF